VAANDKPLPRGLTPLPTTGVGWNSTRVPGWLAFQGGQTRGKGRASVEGNDPRNEASEPELVGFDEHDMPIFKEGKQIGAPVVVTGHTGEPGDTSLIHIPELEGHGSDEPADEPLKGGTTKPISADELVALIEGIYGTKGAIRNQTADPFGAALGLHITTPLPTPGPLGHVTTPGPMPVSGHSTPVSIGLPGGMMIDVPTSGLPGGLGARRGTTFTPVQIGQLLLHAAVAHATTQGLGSLKA